MESKYKCPRCFTVSCCLDCVRHHKRAHACSGVRNKSRYIATSQFTDLDMLNGEERKFIRKVRMPLTPCLRFPDYRLLEEVDRSVDNYSRDSLKRITNKGEEAKPLPKVNPRGEPLVFNHSLPITFQYLLSLRDACKRRKTRIHFLPALLTRRKQNSTRLIYDTDVINWKVDLVFPHCQRSENQRIVIPR